MVAERQLQFRGHTIGKNSDFKIISMTGLEVPRIRSTDLNAIGNGQHAGLDAYDGRTVTIAGYLREYDDADMSTKRHDLATAWLIGGGTEEEPLTFQIPGIAGGGRRRIYCRPRGDALTIDRGFTLGTARDVFQLHATDPRIYDDVESQASVLLASGAGGLTWPLTWPLDWGSTRLGLKSVINDGNAAAGARFTMYGPVTNPRVENITTGQTIELSLQIAAGEFVEVNTALGVVLLNGTASRFSALTVGSELFLLQPGVNEIRYAANASGIGSSLGIGFRSAWFT
ncbi:MAG: hypothetical protein AAGA37_19765 [Actinomycetota bacterium]